MSQGVEQVYHTGIQKTIHRKKKHLSRIRGQLGEKSHGGENVFACCKNYRSLDKPPYMYVADKYELSKPAVSTWVSFHKCRSQHSEYTLFVIALCRY